MKLGIWSSFFSGMNFYGKDELIKKQVKKNNLTVYGARAIKAHIGSFARPTQDWDIFSKHPRKSAKKLEKTLDSRSGQDVYFTKPAQHSGTYKVKHKGLDGKEETKDDLEVADFTKPERKVKTVSIRGINYVHLSEVVKDKNKALRDKQSKFRWKKDRDDLNRIKSYRRFKR